MARWSILYYESEAGTCEVEDFLNEIKTSNKAKAMAWIGMLEEKGPQLPRPYADLLRDGIHELRIRLSGEHGRVLYFFTCGDILVLTHAFTKNSAKVPNEEIEKAIRIRNEFIGRFPNREALNEILQKTPPRRTSKK